MAGSNQKAKLMCIYRTSNSGYKKEKLDITKEYCLDNFKKEFSNVYVVADSSPDIGADLHINEGSNAGSFRKCLEIALESNFEYIYFCENDYLHKKGAEKVLLEGLQIAPIVTLYDHPDKYTEPQNVISSKLYVGNSTHWRTTPSTTMTFAINKHILVKLQNVIYKYVQGEHPYDHYMFLELTKYVELISCIPGYSTHIETNFLSPLTNWNKI